MPDTSHLAARQLTEFIRRTWPDDAGYDPYDALNSPLVSALTARSRRFGVAVTQFLRVFPWNIRPWLGIRPHKNPKTIALLARANVHIAQRGMHGSAEAQLLARTHLSWLAANYNAEFGQGAWGSSFGFQTRGGLMPKGEPSSLVGAFVAQAFLDAYSAWHDPTHLAVAQAAAEFILDCPRYVSSAGVCISYVHSGLVLVHNANVLAAAALAEVWQAGGRRDDRLVELAERAVAYTIADQRQDGAWYYGGPPRAAPSYIDGYHTGFVLEGLDRVQRALGADYSAAIQRGLAFYTQRLLDASGRPRRTIERPHNPLDVGAIDGRDCAVALLTLERFHDRAGVANSRKAVLDWTLANMRDQRGYFYSRQGGLFGKHNGIPYIRWQAWMLLALNWTAHQDGDDDWKAGTTTPVGMRR